MKDIFENVVEQYKKVEANEYLGIFGYPINHTLSPVIHDNLSMELGIDLRYVPFEIKPNELQESVSCAFSQEIRGLNITVPFKQDVMKYITSISEEAKQIGAVNTLVRSNNGFKGYNTDMPGLAKALISEDILIADRKIVILGAGGAARSVVYMALKNNAKSVYIINRTYTNAQRLADDMNGIMGTDRVRAFDTNTYKDIEHDKYIFIQCTSVGLKKGDGLPLNLSDSFYSMCETAVDLIYNPALTPFLELMKSKGVKICNGLKMLLYQGIMAYELWNDIRVSDELSELVYAKLSRKLYGDNIILVGYMGSGKTSVGKVIADQLGYDFIDTDEYIEQHEKMSINEIFASKGENYFRVLETNLLKELRGTTQHLVISTGGGMPIREENRKYMADTGRIFYLSASPDTIFNRLKNDTSRPLLKGENLLDRINSMINCRCQYYKDNSTEINVDDMTVKEIAIEIVNCI